MLLSCASFAQVDREEFLRSRLVDLLADRLRAHPAGTPQDIVRKLNADINRILQTPDVRFGSATGRVA